MSEIKKNGAPTMKTIGALGDVYTDISTGAQYKCTGSYNIGGQLEYEWEKMQKAEVEPAEPEIVDVTEPETEVVEEEPVAVEVIAEQPKEEPKPENNKPNKSNNRPNNNRTDYTSKFKG